VCVCCVCVSERERDEFQNIANSSLSFGTEGENTEVVHEFEAI
jgi:hypothetical protein